MTVSYFISMLLMYSSCLCMRPVFCYPRPLLSSPLLSAPLPFSTLSPPHLSLKDIKNAELALYELGRVTALEPNSPEVYEQRAEVRAVTIRSTPST